MADFYSETKKNLPGMDINVYNKNMMQEFIS